MDDIVIDTHIAIWYFADPTKLSKPAESAIDMAAANGIVFVSAITIVELIYLTEKGKIPPDVLDLLRDAPDDSTTNLVTSFHINSRKSVLAKRREVVR